MSKLFRTLLAGMGLFAATPATAQSPFAERLQELVRSSQLASYDSLGGSLMVNAFQVPLYPFDSVPKTITPHSGALQVDLLPVSTVMQYNTQLPYNWNLGAMVPAKGLQVLASAGVRLRWGSWWQLQLQPEWVSAQNRRFETMSQELNPRLWRDYFRYYYNITDIPERPGNGAYHKLLPGQSSLSFSQKNFVFALSTASKWWGPGYRNALVLSSNAPGFLHFSAATKKPLKTSVGNFEGEMLAGTLRESGVRPPRSYTAYEGQFVYPEKNTEDRYLTGVTINWQPKWVPGLFVGFAKASYLYPSDISSPLDVLPLQGVMGKTLTRSEKAGKKASLGSFFLRYVLPEEHAEVYVEYGRKDRATFLWNAVSAKPQRYGYVAGLRKMFAAGKQGAYLQLAAEITQLQVNSGDLVGQPGSWYTHPYVMQGYTHLGRTLGAGIGPGSNAQSFEINWMKGSKRIGLQLERLRHNGDYYYGAMTYLGDYRRHWVNLSGMLKGDWDFGPVRLHGSLGLVRSLNHYWIVVEARENYYFAGGNEYLNVASQLGVQYHF